MDPSRPPCYSHALRVYLCQGRFMAIPPRLQPLLEQFDYTRDRLVLRMAGPSFDSGDNELRQVSFMTDGEYFWEPVADSLSIRRRVDGPGLAATRLVGAGDWGRDSTYGSHPSPPPFSTIAWRLNHLAEMLARRADYTIGDHSLTADVYRIPGSAIDGIAALKTGAASWRKALITADDAALDMVGRSTYPDGGDPEQPFLEVVWWVNQELLHHGAEIALLRDLYQARLA
jgi:DinB superfamily